jgi:hypothetical protein
MLAVQILNDSPQLNSYSQVLSVAYIPGENVTINFQLLDVDAAIRFIPPTTAVVTVGFKQSDGTTLTKTTTQLFPSDDRSIFQVMLSSVDSNLVVGQNMLISVDMLGDGTNIQQAIANNVLAKTFFEGDC